MEEKTISTGNLSRAITKLLEMISGCKAVAVDITDKIALHLDEGVSQAPNLEHLTATPIKYTYNPSLGIVFFVIELQYRGSMAAGDYIQFNHTGGYAPGAPVPFGMTSTADIDSLIFKYEDFDGDCSLTIKPVKAIGPTGTITSNYLTGWYFCNGE